MLAVRYNMNMDYRAMGERLRAARRKADMTQAEVAEKLHVSEGAYGHYETGKSEPKLETLNTLADIFHITVDELMGREYAGHEPEPVMPIYTPGPMIYVPVYGAIRAGEPMLVYEEFLDYETVDADDFEKGDFYLEVTGDSMEPDHIPSGARVLVRPQLEVSPTEIAVINIDENNATLGRVRFHEGQAMIYKSNPNYLPQIYPESEIRVVGRVVEWKIKPKLK